MASVVTLPEDILHIIARLLLAQREYGTLFNCALAGGCLSDIAISLLYRGHQDSPIIKEDKVENYEDGLKSILQWAGLWRSLLLSTKNKTHDLYASYIRVLSLRDFGQLLEDARLQDPGVDFFDGLEDICHGTRASSRLNRDNASERPLLRLNRPQIMADAGNMLVDRAPLIEELEAATVPSVYLSRWVAKLPKLQSLSVWDGAVLNAEIGMAIATNCPSFKQIAIYLVSDAEKLSSFLQQLRADCLKSFYVIGRSAQVDGNVLGVLTSCFATSLRVIKLADLSIQALNSLPDLKSCLNLEVFELSCDDKRARISDDALNIVVNWLAACTKLKILELSQFWNAASICAAILRSPETSLHSLHVTGYSAEDARTRAFYGALSTHTSLETLQLRSSMDDSVPEPFQAFYVEPLINLRWFSLSMDFFSNDQWISCLPHLSRLTELTMTGSEISDSIFGALTLLRQLVKLDMNVQGHLTPAGTEKFILGLSKSNQGLALSINITGSDETCMPDESIDYLKRLTEQRVKGSFEYVFTAESLEVVDSDGDE